MFFFFGGLPEIRRAGAPTAAPIVLHRFPAVILLCRRWQKSDPIRRVLGILWIFSGYTLDTPCTLDILWIYPVLWIFSGYTLDIFWFWIYGSEYFPDLVVYGKSRPSGNFGSSEAAARA